MSRLRAGSGVRSCLQILRLLGVFCNDRVDMEEVEVYGFDYDYTLA
jgi:hypothetical protein